MAPAQIGDASAGPDHFCVVVGPAAERDRHGAGVWATGRHGAGCRWPARSRRRGWRRGRCCGTPMGSRSTMRSCSGFRGRRARPARTSPNFTSMADARCWLRCSPRSRHLRMCAPPSPANLPGALLRTASSISPRPKALDDLIHADTDRQRRQALRQLKGLLGDKARDWRAQIIEASALIEAGIDFSDEGDVPAELMAPALAKDQGAARRNRGSACGAGPKLNGCATDWWLRSPGRRTSANRR